MYNLIGLALSKNKFKGIPKHAKNIQYKYTLLHLISHKQIKSNHLLVLRFVFELYKMFGSK